MEEIVRNQNKAMRTQKPNKPPKDRDWQFRLVDILLTWIESYLSKLGFPRLGFKLRKGKELFLTSQHLE